MDGDDVVAAVAGLRRAVDDLLAVSLAGVEGAELLAVLEGVEVQRRRLEAVDQRLLARAQESSLASVVGQPGLADVLASVLRIDPGQARGRVRRAGDLGPRRALTGEPLPPLLPAVAQAVQTGAVSAAQTEVITSCLAAIPASVPAGVWPVAERLLVQAAGQEAPRALRRTAAELLARLDPDGVEPVEERAERRRSFTLIRRPDGTAVPRGVWTAEATALWETLLDSLAGPQPAADGQPDPRSAGQRRHDAMVEATSRLLRSATLPAAGGVPVTVLATTTINELTAAAAKAAGGRGKAPGAADPAPTTPTELLGRLEAQEPTSGLALLGHGQVVSARTLLALAGEAEVVPVVFNQAGGVLAYGRGRRLASRTQRLALAARDGGCTFPGCDRPAAWTEVHHITEWATGGPTDLANMCLVCRYHHRNFARADWRITMTDGRPAWIPPAWLDPHQTPRRNTTHHRPDLDFRQPTTAA